MNKEDFRIVFMGTPEFAVESLKSLIENNYKVVGVVTIPDKPSGRGQKLTESAVKKYAITKNIKILQPEKLKNEEFLTELSKIQADLQIVVAFRMLPELVWKMPKYGTINLHASLLPEYRGAAPINWAIINGEKETGVTTFFIEEQIDTGKIIFQEKCPINPDDNAGIIHDRLMQIGSELVLKTIESIISGKYNEVSQIELIRDTTLLKAAPKLEKSIGKINWDNGVMKIHNLIRGLSPYPCAWSELIYPNGTKKILKIYATKATIEHHNFAIGEIVSNQKNQIKVSAKDGFIELEIIQPENKKQMKAGEFLNGNNLSGCKFV